MQARAFRRSAALPRMKGSDTRNRGDAAPAAIAHVGSWVPACSATRYSAYQSGRFGSVSPVRSSCSPCAAAARRSAPATSLTESKDVVAESTRPGRRVVISCSDQALPSGRRTRRPRHSNRLRRGRRFLGQGAFGAVSISGTKLDKVVDGRAADQFVWSGERLAPFSTEGGNYDGPHARGTRNL